LKSMAKWVSRLGMLAVLTALTAGMAMGQNQSLAQAAPVTFLYPEQVTLAAGRTSAVTLHFRIAQGLHINSHVPGQEFLIPTTFSIPPGSGARLEGASYPPGSDLTLPVDPKNHLSVYTGEFDIQARIVAAPGNHLVQGRLRFQACDSNQCLPPRSIPVAIDVIGK
jgi:Thiol:disulfide interchange protein DsbD, N-terminal